MRARFSCGPRWCWVFSAIGADQDLLLEEVLDGGVIEYALGCFSRFEPGVAHGAGGPPVGAFVGRRLVDELVRHHGAFQSGDDIAQRQLARITGELMAAVRTSDAVDDADSSEAAQQLIEIRLGDLLARGKLSNPINIISNSGVADQSRTPA